ncbi:hypothetical protein ACFWP0_12150 [Achromobacter sp. NPDC058515]|uniref:hypothetical protein n=1 Tax=Achromobacter sp. NPDC058515 TaxID=3346533 RepID=UPI003658C445
MKPATKFESLIDELLRKLGVKPEEACTENQGVSVRIIVNAQTRRLCRHLTMGGRSVEIVSQAALTKSFSPPEDPKALPRRNVDQYVKVLARVHGLSSERTALDGWAEAVSRAAGDSVQLDSIGRLLARLKQQHVIDGKQMAYLMNNYMDEKCGAASSV